MTTPMLDIEGVGARFGGVQALEGASFSVRANTITGLIGPNGAGKTTLFDCVSGLLNRYTGHITFDGRAISRLRPESISRRGLLRSFQLARGCPRLTVFEHLMLYGPRQSGESAVRALISRKAIRRQEEALRARVIAVAQRLRLNRVLDNLVTDLSGGQKKLLEIGRVLLGAPRMILLDEPMAGVNPSLVGEIAEHLSVIRDEGITILLIEHEMELIERLCDDVVVMAEGKFLTQGTFHEVTDDRRVQESYLGLRRQ